MFISYFSESEVPLEHSNLLHRICRGSIRATGEIKTWRLTPFGGRLLWKSRAAAAKSPDTDATLYFTILGGRAGVPVSTCQRRGRSNAF
jgi:hypothetical protein